MKPIRASAFSDAMPVDGRGHRSSATLAMLDERNALLIEARRFYAGASGREVARQLRIALARYHAGRWRRDRACEVCPPQHRGKLVQVMWLIFKGSDRLVSEMTIRRALFMNHGL